MFGAEGGQTEAPTSLPCLRVHVTFLVSVVHMLNIKSDE